MLADAVAQLEDGILTLRVDLRPAAPEAPTKVERPRVAVGTQPP